MQPFDNDPCDMRPEMPFAIGVLVASGNDLTPGHRRFQLKLEVGRHCDFRLLGFFGFLAFAFGLLAFWLMAYGLWLFGLWLLAFGFLAFWLFGFLAFWLFGFLACGFLSFLLYFCLRLSESSASPATPQHHRLLTCWIFGWWLLTSQVSVDGGATPPPQKASLRP